MDEQITKRANEGLGIASLVCGILSVVFFLLLINIPFAVAAVSLGIMHLAHQGSKKTAVTGMVLGVISIVMMVAGWAIMYRGLSQVDPGVMDRFRQQLLQQYL